MAASVGPYGAALADGSEYRGRYGLTVGELAAWHRPRLEVLASAGADVLALETIPDADEAEALVGALDGLAAPAWLSYSVAGARTRAGQPLAEAFAVVADAPQIVAVGVNCCDPVDVAPAIAVAREVTGKPVIVYPNSGEGWDAAGRRWTGRSRFSAADAAHVGVARGRGSGRMLPGGPGRDRGGGARGPGLIGGAAPTSSGRSPSLPRSDRRRSDMSCRYARHVTHFLIMETAGRGGGWDGPPRELP